jgi:hypothetical protein
LLHAVAFRDKYRGPRASIFEVDAADDIGIYIGDFDLISTLITGTAFVDTWSSRAIKYWSDPPNGIQEVIIGGPVTIVKKL